MGDTMTNAQHHDAIDELINQDHLLRNAGYRPHNIKDVSPLTIAFYEARWLNRDISGYWRKLSESRVNQELHVKDYVPIEV